jgi:hypothetical protein
MHMRGLRFTWHSASRCRFRIFWSSTLGCLIVSKDYGANLSPGSPLRKDLETLNGEPLDENEVSREYVIEDKHVGQRCSFEIMHKSGSGGRPTMVVTLVKPPTKQDPAAATRGQNQIQGVYTPRSFTEPIVWKTLEPILKRFGEQPKPEQILELKICDIAVGSAAFLVETCRQLADVLVKAWTVHGGRPQLPPDETEELLAMRLIAQRCLYGVDRNTMATDLAKLSLWLATLAKNHPFTFIDHAIRCGDSLVGLTRKQIEDFTWGDTKTSMRHLFADEVRKRTTEALRERQALLGLGDESNTTQLKAEKLKTADKLLNDVRFIGDAAICAFFSADKDKAREGKRQEFIERLSDTDISKRPIAEVKALRGGKFPVMPFHWEIEFPEVFDRENPGFDGIVGNPPFLGGRRTSTTLGDAFSEWLSTTNEESSNNADLAAFFFRRAFNLLRDDGSFGLLATNTIAQGDTRQTGLRWIRKSGGNIFDVVKRLKWPGQAAVIVSVVHKRHQRNAGAGRHHASGFTWQFQSAIQPRRGAA